MNHTRERRLIPRLLRLLPIGVDRPHHDIAAPIAAIPTGLVREADHLARVRVELGVRRKRRRDDLALKVVAAERLERDGVHGERRTVLLGREQHAAPEGDVGVARGAHDAPDRLVVRPRIAVPPEQAAPRRRLGAEPVRPDVPLLEVGVAPPDAHRRHGAVAVEVDVVLEERREPLVRLDAVEGPVDVPGQRARHLEVEDVALEPRRRVHAREHGRVGEPRGLAWRGEIAGGVVAGLLDAWGEIEDVSHGEWCKCYHFVMTC